VPAADLIVGKNTRRGVFIIITVAATEFLEIRFSRRPFFGRLFSDAEYPPARNRTAVK